MTLPEDQSRQEILEKIKSGQVEMHSKAFLAWRTVMWVLGILLVLAAGAFVVSFMAFVVQISGVGDLPRFGAHGLREFLVYFPWLFVPAALLFVWLFERFVRQYAFAYRLPVLYVVLASMVLIVVAGFLCAAGSLHSRLYYFVRQDKVPFAPGVYGFFQNYRPDDFYVGEIQSVKQDGCALLTGQGQQINVLVNNQTQLFNHYMLKPGDYIEVLGDERGPDIQAFDIRQVPPPGNFPPR